MMEVQFSVVGLMPDDEHDIRDAGEPWPRFNMDVPRADDYVTFPRKSGGEMMLRVRSVTFFPLGEGDEPNDIAVPFAYVVVGP